MNEGHLMRGILWGLLISVPLWGVLIVVIHLALSYGSLCVFLPLFIVALALVIHD